MCSCTHESPFECESKLWRDACPCSCHRQWKASRQVSTQPGPKQPLEERDAEIERLRSQVKNRRIVERLTVAGIDAARAVDGLKSVIDVAEPYHFARIVLLKERARTLDEEIQVLLSELKGDKQR